MARNRSCLVVLGAGSLVVVTLSAQPAPSCEQWNTQEFFEAATLEQVTACLAAGTDVMATTDDGHTPLHYAAQLNADPAVVEALLAAGAELNAGATENRHAPLHEAARYNKNPAVIEVLLAAEADPVMQDGDGATPLHWAAFGNPNVTVTEIFLTAGTEVDARSHNGRTPLHNTAGNNQNPAVIDLLLSAGADIEARDDDGFTPLHRAASVKSHRYRSRFDPPRYDDTPRATGRRPERLSYPSRRLRSGRPSPSDIWPDPRPPVRARR